ncbi:MAG: hypothetical protein D6760_00150 [Deltaproteobacteria bacterium]|nr:MAG: hypothetical protein D6760_00150 [Deltaproteobacteria bacterium]
MAIAVVVWLVAATGGCGSTGSVSSPTPPTAVIKVTSWLVDVGGRFQLDASDSTDPKDRELDFTWTIVHPTSQAEFEDHCEDVPAEICTHNDDDPCSDDPNTFCTSNADCATGTCMINAGTTSSECSTGKCLVGKGNHSSIATFIGDVPGPYSVRLLAESSRANDVATMVLDTYPSLFVVGSLFAFGGTQGAAIGEFADAASFAAGATRGVSNPATGNILLAVPGAGLVREFDYRDGSVVGTFGETAAFSSDPVALAFDASGRLFVADSDGRVQIYDGSTGLFIRTFGDVAAGGESVSAIAFSPVTGNLLVVDGAAGKAVREYDAAGNLVGPLGATGAAAGVAVDLAFADDGTNDLLIADGDGDVIRCASDGTGCSSFGSASSVLQAGGPTAIEVNPSDAAPSAKVLIADSVLGAVVGCSGDGATCGVFGETDSISSSFSDVLFAPPAVPTTTTTTVSTTSTTVTTTTVP